MRWRTVRNLFWRALFIAAWRENRHAAAEPKFHTIIRGGLIVDGTASQPYRADIGLAGGRIAAIGDLSAERGRDEFDATGLAVAPGFINCLSWATESLIADPNSQSDLRQGVTLEVFGEGVSMGPLTHAMKRDLAARQSDYRFDVEWTTLGEYLEMLERRGVATNVASFVGATTLRVHEVGYQNRAATPAELARMCDRVREAMLEGALGVGSALIYAPAAFAAHAELKALALAAAEFGGGYFTHMRSEAGRLLESIAETIDIARATGAHTEIYHFKAAGREAWSKLDAAIALIESARAAGVDISANMYPYTAAASGLDAVMPPWVQSGGHNAWISRLRDPAIRARVIEQMREPDGDWENLLVAAGSPDNVLLLGFRNERLKPLVGRTLADVARERNCSAEQAAIDLVLEDDSRVTAAYFLMSEENVRRQLALPWITLCSDEESIAPHGVFLSHRPHPRAYGSFARFLGAYARDQQLVPLADAVHRLTGLPARQLRLQQRGELRPGHWADVVVFDPARISDHATFAQPHRFASGVEHVFVNGVQVLRSGQMTGARPGRVVRGPGWRAARDQGLEPRQDLPRAAG